MKGSLSQVNDATPRTGPRRPRQQPSYGGGEGKITPLRPESVASDFVLASTLGGGTYRYGRPYGMGGMPAYGRPVPVPMRPGVYDSMPGARPYGGYAQPEMAPSVYQANYGGVSAYPG